MTTYTPAQARELAPSIDRLCTFPGGPDGGDALRSLADQIEALTAENKGWEASQKENLSNQCNLQDQINALTKERDALKNAAMFVKQSFDALKPSDPARMAKLNINALRFALNDMKETK